MSIVMTSDVTGYFREVVGAALDAQHVEATGGAREYLVGLLADFAGRGASEGSLDRPLTLQLREALEAPRGERFERLKGLGDSSLYVSGLFREHLAARGVDVGYVASVGATAYNGASALLHAGDGRGVDLFGELAENFRRFVEVLHEVGDAIFAASARDAGSVLRLYERWQRTGSRWLGRELAARGLVPVKPAGGVQ